MLINKHLFYRWIHPQTDGLMKSNMSCCTIQIEMFSKQRTTYFKDKILLCTNQFIWRENEYLKLQILFVIYKLNMSFLCNFNIKLVAV